MYIVHCYIDNKWQYLKCYRKNNHYHTYGYNEEIDNKLIFWVDNDN